LDIDFDDNMTPPHPTAETLAAMVGSGSLVPDRTPTTTTTTAFQKEDALSIEVGQEWPPTVAAGSV
jgi:hypothetical protein